MARTFNHLTYEQRCQIKSMLDNKTPVREIANALGFHHSAIYREIDRGKVNGIYDPEFSESKYQKHLESCGTETILSSDRELAQAIADYILKDNYSPKKIAALLQERKDEFTKAPSFSTIYNAIDAGLIPGVTRDNLRPTETKVFNNGTICLASWVREELGIKDGDILHFEIEGGNIVFSKQ